MPQTRVSEIKGNQLPLFTLTTDGALDDQVTLREVPLSFSCFDVLV